MATRCPRHTAAPRGAVTQRVPGRPLVPTPTQPVVSPGYPLGVWGARGAEPTPPPSPRTPTLGTAPPPRVDRAAIAPRRSPPPPSPPPPPPRAVPAGRARPGSTGPRPTRPRR